MLSTNRAHIYLLKVDSHLPPQKNHLIAPKKSPVKIVKNTFYFILKALFVFKMFKVLSWLFRDVEKTASIERYG